MKLVRWLAAAIAVLAIVILTIANRDAVRLSLDPFQGPDAALSVEVPLFAVGYAAFILGIVVGVAAEWLNQGRWRKALRRSQAEAKSLSRDLEKAQSQPVVAQPGQAAIAPPDGATPATGHYLTAPQSMGQRR